MTLAIFSTNTRALKSSAEVQSAKGDCTSTERFSALFSVLQTAQTAQPAPAGADRAIEAPKTAATGEKTEDAAAGPEISDVEMTMELQAPGTRLPLLPETGKILPPALPLEADDDETAPGKGGQIEIVQSGELAVEVAQIAVAAPASVDLPQPHPGTRTAAPSAGPSSTAPAAETVPTVESGGRPDSAEAKTGEGQSQGDRPGGQSRTEPLSVPIHVAPRATETRAEAPANLAAPLAQDLTPPGFPAVQAGSEQGTATTQTAMGSFKPLAQETDIQDIVRIVDRLAAAREAVQPAAVTMAIDHAEFGELSLRFDQQRSGQLSVQLSASSAEAQAALAVAASQHGGGATAGDSSAGGQTQQHQQAQTQSQTQNGGRGAQAERDLHSGNGHSARDERHKQGGNANSQHSRPQHDRPRGGVFA